MASWSKRRRFTYAGILIVLLVAVVGVPSFLLFYKAPTCSDGKRNGEEQGIDCGGACTKLCPDAFLPPSILWTRFEEVAPHLYNVIAYIVNPNQKVMAANTPYRMTLYDSKGIQIAQTSGEVTIPAGRNTLAFQASVSTGIQTPIRAITQFTGIPDWAYDRKPPVTLSVVDQKYTESSTTSSLLVTLANDSQNDLSDVTVYAILKDKDGNTVGFSKTIIDAVPPLSSAVAPFTWAHNHADKVVSIEVLSVAE
jgi:hypothetical protein